MVKVEKLGEFLIIDESTLQEHISLGWQVIERDVKVEALPTDEEDISKLSANDIKAKLTELNVDFDKSAKKDELLELLKSELAKTGGEETE